MGDGAGKVGQVRLRILKRNGMEDGKTRGPTVGLCALPPIEQKTLDGWGTRLVLHCWNNGVLLFVGRKTVQHDFPHALGSDALVILLCERVVGGLRPKMWAHSRLLDVGVHFQA